MMRGRGRRRCAWRIRIGREWARRGTRARGAPFGVQKGHPASLEMQTSHIAFERQPPSLGILLPSSPLISSRPAPSLAIWIVDPPPHFGYTSYRRDTLPHFGYTSSHLIPPLAICPWIHTLPSLLWITPHIEAKRHPPALNLDTPHFISSHPSCRDLDPLGAGATSAHFGYTFSRRFVSLAFWPVDPYVARRTLDICTPHIDALTLDTPHLISSKYLSWIMYYLRFFSESLYLLELLNLCIRTPAWIVFLPTSCVSLGSPRNLCICTPGWVAFLSCTTHEFFVLLDKSRLGFSEGQPDMAGTFFRCHRQHHGLQSLRRRNRHSALLLRARWPTTAGTTRSTYPGT